MQKFLKLINAIHTVNNYIEAKDNLIAEGIDIIADCELSYQKDNLKLSVDCLDITNPQQVKEILEKLVNALYGIKDKSFYITYKEGIINIQHTESLTYLHIDLEKDKLLVRKFNDITPEPFYDLEEAIKAFVENCPTDKEENMTNEGISKEVLLKYLEEASKDDEKEIINTMKDLISEGVSKQTILKHCNLSPDVAKKFYEKASVSSFSETVFGGFDPVSELDSIIGSLKKEN